MALFDAVMSGSLGLAKGIARGTWGFARATPGGFMAAVGGAVGAGLAVAQGDNHDSTSILRNVLAGGAAGAAVGLTARGLFSHTAARGAGHFLGISQARSAASGMRAAAFGKSPLGKMLGTSGRGARGVVGASTGILGFAARHPAMTLSAGILGGGALAMSGDWTTEQDTSDRFSLDNKDVEQYGGSSFASSSFANSANGLCFGLSKKRHR